MVVTGRVKAANATIVNLLDEEGLAALSHALDLALSAQTTASSLANDGGWVAHFNRDPQGAVRTYAFALCDEIHELAAELGWKPWKTNGTIDRQKVLDEYADVWAFFAILTGLVEQLTGASSEELAMGYRVKAQQFVGRYQTAPECSCHLGCQLQMFHEPVEESEEIWSPGQGEKTGG